ncbi:MAG: hypothetical protein HZB29_09935 [Nitrospinae bacterium]|nr:hypothetical protein [Nitrospinota bacterium]
MENRSGMQIRCGRRGCDFDAEVKIVFTPAVLTPRAGIEIGWMCPQCGEKNHATAGKGVDDINYALSREFAAERREG